MQNKFSEEFYSIDLLRLIKTLWQKIWVLLIAGLICAGIGFSVSFFFIPPKYAATTMLYVNNSTFSVGKANFSISSSEISAAQSLVKTYIVILKNRTTLEEVINKTGVDYSYEELLTMITAESVSDTEVFHVTVTSDDPQEAAKLANTISKVLPVRVADIIEGSSMRLVDHAVCNPKKVSPSITKYTAIGFLAGFLIIAAVICIRTVMDDVIHNESYLLSNYDIPVLACVPNLTEKPLRKYGYYNKHYGEKE